jgi:hypothetical protein
VSDKLTVFVNDESVFEYNLSIELDGQQLVFLDKMDSDMSQGIIISGDMIAEPDKEHRAEFVAMNLIKALQQDNEASVMVCCAYLTQRYSDLLEVRVIDGDERVVVEFVVG